MPLGALVSAFERGEIWGLHRHAGLSTRDIATKVGRPRSTVQGVIARIEREGVPSTPRRASGRPTVFNTRTRRRFLQRALADAYHRRLSYEAIADLEGIKISAHTIRKKLKQNGYSRYAATRKPLLTDKQKVARLKWAEEHVDWT